MAAILLPLLLGEEEISIHLLHPKSPRNIADNCHHRHHEFPVKDGVLQVHGPFSIDLRRSSSPSSTLSQGRLRSIPLDGDSGNAASVIDQLNLARSRLAHFAVVHAECPQHFDAVRHDGSRPCGAQSTLQSKASKLLLPASPSQSARHEPLGGSLAIGSDRTPRGRE